MAHHGGPDRLRPIDAPTVGGLGGLGGTGPPEAQAAQPPELWGRSILGIQWGDLARGTVGSTPRAASRGPGRFLLWQPCGSDRPLCALLDSS